MRERRGLRRADDEVPGGGTTCAAVVILPDKTGTDELGEPFAGENMWESDRGDDLENSMTRPVDLSAAATAALTLEARYEIEAGFDYLYVQASTWIKVPDTGTRIRVASVDDTSMRIRVSSS